MLHDKELSTASRDLSESQHDDSPSSAGASRESSTNSLQDLLTTEELWRSILKLNCTFPPEIFQNVMLNLIKNPNITSSHLFRADILLDEDTSDVIHDGKALSQHLKQELKPRQFDLPSWTKTRTIVRRLIPRNIQLDNPLVQTCHFFTQSNDDGGDECLVVYQPHVEKIEEIPFYHPAVSRLAFHHTWSAESESKGSLSLYYCLFEGTEMTERLSRTGLKLLQTIHKHGQGQLAGYEKRVHLDQIIPQKAYQDTYTRLKIKYGKALADSWVEVTDPGKHVFEDIGIASFLIELWKTMYQVSKLGQPSQSSAENDGEIDKSEFPGFIDIGCGNGVLTYILLSEGYEGAGFDARRRKTWSTFPAHIQAKLEERLLVPKILLDAISYIDQTGQYHDGVFPTGTFIISNHADELTAWTPLLAYLNNGTFLALPCCSHDFTGTRFRAPPTVKRAKPGKHGEQAEVVRLPQQQLKHLSLDDEEKNGEDTIKPKIKDHQAAESGSLARTLVQKKMISAYATLCLYVESITDAIGFKVEKEVLRIPSTRNQSIIGRVMKGSNNETVEQKEEKVSRLVEEELGKSIDIVAREWIERAEKISQKAGKGHC